MDKVCGEHDVGDVEILWQLADVFGHQVCFHQAIGRIGVGHFYSEDHSQEKTHYILHKLPWLAVTANRTCADHRIIAASLVPEGLEFIRVGLSVRISLENVICMILNSIAVSIKNCRTMSTIWFVQRNKQGTWCGAFLQKLVCMILASVIDDHKPGFAFIIVPLHHRIPLVNGSLNIRRFVIRWNYDI